MNDYYMFSSLATNDNKDPSNVDKTFVERLRVRKLQEEVDNMLEDIDAAAKLNGFFGPLVGESYPENMSFDDIIIQPSDPYLQQFYFYNMFSPHRPKPRIVSRNDAPLESSIKAHLELVKSDNNDLNQ